MVADEDRAALLIELRSLDQSIEHLRAERQGLAEDLREPDEGALAGVTATEEELLVASLERRRDELRRRLDQVTTDRSASVFGLDQVLEPDDDELRSFDDDPRTVAHEGRGEDMDPAVWPEEWTAPGGDQLSEAADVDDPVEALEVGGLWAGTEATASADATELADRAAPTPPEEAALTDRVGVSPEDDDDLTVGLPSAVDLDRLEVASLDDLIEAELVAINAGDPETVAIIAAELDRRRTDGDER